MAGMRGPYKKDVEAAIYYSKTRSQIQFVSRTSDQDRSAINHYGLPSRESFLHQKQIGLRYVVGFADASYGQTFAYALIQMLPFCCRQVLLQVRSNDAGRHCIHAYRGQFQRKGACQGFDRSADTGSNSPSFMRALPGNSAGEHD